MARPAKKIVGLFEKVEGSGIWYIRYRTGGKSIRRMIGDRAEAEAELTRVKLIKKGIAQGVIPKSAKERAKTQAGGPTIAQLADEYLAYIQDPKNPRSPKDQFSPPQRIRVIKEAFGGRPAASIKAHEIEDWLISLDKKPATLNRYRSVFSSVYKYAKKRAKIDINPVRDLSQFRVELPNPRWLQPEEETRLVGVLSKWIEECPPEQRLRKLYLRCHRIELTVALGTGLRKGNQYALRWDEHVNFAIRRFSLPPAMTKTGKALNLPMNDEVYAALTEMKDIKRQIAEIHAEDTDKERRRMVADGRVFNTSENREWWAAALKEAKIENLRWHDLRHTFATRLMALSKDMKVVQIACGHGSIATTTRYAHVDDERLFDEIAKLSRPH
ncbi:MAG TPA: site-specific integrase [Edaphobacter sp.]